MKHSPPRFTGSPKTHASAYTIIGAAAVLAASLAGCGEGDTKQAVTKAQVTSAKWETGTDSAKLVATGTAPARQEVVLRNAGTNAVLGSAKASASGQWTLTAALPSPPCQVVADTSRSNATAAVAVAGTTKATCTQTVASSAQSARAIRANAIVRAAATLPEPNGVIVSPVSRGQAIQLNVNDTLSFTAVGTAPGETPTTGPLTPLTYSWNFDGAAPNAVVQNPGTIKFSRAGVFNVRLTVTNRLGIPDPTPSERTIIVTNPTQTTLAALTAAITSPVGDTTIPVGGVVNFDAMASGGNAPYKFIWNFGGAGPSSNAQTPGSVTFTRAGTFIVRLTVEDTAVPPAPAERFATPLQVTITVANSSAAANQPPTGVILSPATDLTIVSGDTVFFQGTAIDPDNNTPMTYAWDFGGGAPASIEQNPGLIAFTNTSSTPVVYTVKMVASDALAAVDANPPTRTITVNSVGTATAHMPVVTIDNPSNDNFSVNVGVPVQFVGTATSPDGNPLETLWSFAGVAPDSIELIPPPVTFNTAGEYLITFTAIDPLNALSSMVERLVTVVDPTAPTPPPAGSPGAPFEAEIDQPRGRIKIQPGDSIEFAGSVELPLNAVGDPAAYTYAWTFPGGDPAESTEQIPGAVMFLDPGHFDVTLVVTEIATGIVSEPETKHIYVGDVNAPPPGTGTGAGTNAPPVPNPDAPMASIDSPTGDVTIMLGDTIEFLGSGTDPNGLPLTFRWSFGRNMPGSTVQNPGNVTFDKVGVFNVKLEVTNPNGLEGKARIKVTVDAPPPAAP